MSAAIGLIVGVLAAASIGVAVPSLSFARWLLAAWLLSSAIVTAAWWLP